MSRKRIMTPAQQVELLTLAAQAIELGTVKRAILKARSEWNNKRRGIGRTKEWAVRFGVSKSTISDFIHGKSLKCGTPFNGYSATSLRARASGIAAAAGTVKPATGVTAAAPSRNSARSKTARLRLSVQNVEIDYEG